MVNLYYLKIGEEEAISICHSSSFGIEGPSFACSLVRRSFVGSALNGRLCVTVNDAALNAIRLATQPTCS